MPNEDLVDKLDAADEWVREQFAALADVAGNLGCVGVDEAGPGRAFRLQGQRVLRVHPKLHHIGVGFPDVLRQDVQALTGGLRDQRGTAWIHYAPQTYDLDTIELLLDLAVQALQSGTHVPAGESAVEQKDEKPDAAEVRAARGGRRGHRNDEADLQLLLDLLRSYQEHERLTGIASTTKVLREALYYVWEGPRLPDGLKYAPSLPHSPAARAHRDAGDRGGLVYEHAVPVTLVIRALLASLPDTTTSLRAQLEAHADRVIITKGEDRLLTAAGLRSRMPDPDDVWSRYRAVGLDPASFVPWRGD